MYSTSLVIHRANGSLRANAFSNDRGLPIGLSRASESLSSSDLFRLVTLAQSVDLVLYQNASVNTVVIILSGHHLVITTMWPPMFIQDHRAGRHTMGRAERIFSFPFGSRISRRTASTTLCFNTERHLLAGTSMVRHFSTFTPYVGLHLIRVSNDHHVKRRRNRQRTLVSVPHYLNVHVGGNLPSSFMHVHRVLRVIINRVQD